MRCPPPQEEADLEPQDISADPTIESNENRAIWDHVVEHCETKVSQRTQIAKLKEQGVKVSERHFKDVKVVVESRNEMMKQRYLALDRANGKNGVYRMATRIRDARKEGASPDEIPFLEPDGGWYVYIVELPIGLPDGQKVHKIGSAVSPNARFRQLQADNWFPLSKVATMEFPTKELRDEAEKAMLKLGEPGQGGGEWRSTLNLQEVYRTGQSFEGKLELWRG